MKIRSSFVVAGAALLVSAACGARTGGPPRIEVDRTACANCGMLISERVYAAAARLPGEEAKVFDDIACLLDAARATDNADRLQMWVHDAATSEWIGAPEAVFVKSANLRTPMGGGMIAFRNGSAAEGAATQHAGRVIASLRELMSQHGRKEAGGTR